MLLANGSGSSVMASSHDDNTTVFVLNRQSVLQVADMMTHVSTAASQQPSSSIAEGCSHPPASPLSSAPTSRPSLQTNPSGSASALLSPHCRAASPAVSASSFVSARNGIPQHPSSLPMFSQYPLEAVLPCPQPWGAPQQPYVLSSLPHVMHQLLEEPSIDFLHSWNLPSFPVQPSASDVAGDQLPAKKPCKGKRQQSAAGHATQNGISQRQTAGESMVGAQQRFSHQQSAPGQSSNSQVGGSSQQHIPRGQASVDQQQSSRMQTGQANGLQATAATSSWPGRPPGACS